jgi:predicted helicase
VKGRAVSGKIVVPDAGSPCCLISNEWKEIQPDLIQIKLITRLPYYKYNYLDSVFCDCNVGIASGDEKKFINISATDLLQLVNELDGYDKKYLRNILYRPFVVQHIYYDTKYIQRARTSITEHIVYDNIVLIASKSNRQNSLGYTFVTSILCDRHILDNAKDASYLFPLYLYEEVDFLGTKQLEKKPNIKPEIFKSLSAKYSKQCVGTGLAPVQTPVGTGVPACTQTDETSVSTTKGGHKTLPYEITPEQVMSYIYPVLHSPTYRTKYADFLKTDFPRIPFTDDYKLFTALAELGWELIQAHLQKDNNLNTQYKGLGDYAVKGDNKAAKPLYAEAQNRLYINSNQYFDKIPSEAYNFYIGGYQVLNKYLKDRKGRTLTLDEINNVESVAKILQFTIDQMQKIDELTREWV